MTLRFPASLLALALLAGGAQAAPAPASPLAAAERLADWQLAHRDDASLVSRFSDETRRANSWEQATFWIGMTALADHLPADRHIAEAVMAMGRGEGWKPGKRPYHADDQAIGQAYLWAA
ncbi:MAG: glycoside hydrolase family 88/105 protein, partial [Sphingomonas oligoaromativorans]